MKTIFFNHLILNLTIKAMRTKNLLKVALTMMALFVFMGVQAQVADINYDNVAETVYQTAGKNFRLYVEPDVIYSPNYNSGAGWVLGTNARWTWTYTGLTGTPVSSSAQNQNWVEFTNPAVGTYSIGVVETNTIVSCDDGGVTKTVEVIAAPTAAITTADPAQACGNQSAMAVQIQFTENVPTTWASYAFAVNETVENIDVSDVVIGLALVNDNSFVNYQTSGKLNALGGTQPNYTWSFNTSALTVQNNLRTRYTYTLIKASDAPAAALDGVISAISQKSDYVGGVVQTHAFGDNQIVIIVNPVPTTGPIYHIPNNFAH